MANINNNNKEPNTAPAANRWYPLTLGSSFSDNSSSKFCTLRYEFKPASIDKSQPGSFHKDKDNRVTVDFQNNQPGKPKVTFDGTSEDYKDNDALLFFDGETFQLERLHRAVKRLRHVRVPGKSAASTSVPAAFSNAIPATESRSPPLGKVAKPQPLNKRIIHAMFGLVYCKKCILRMEIEKIDVGEPKSSGTKYTYRSADYLSSCPAIPTARTPDTKNDELDENCDIDIENNDMNNEASGPTHEPYVDFDINIPNQNDTDDEIADVDVCDDGGIKVPNAAEALRAQVNAVGEDSQSSSSSGSSRSGSGSGSSSSDSEGSDDDDSVSSAGDIDIL